MTLAQWRSRREQEDGARKSNLACCKLYFAASEGGKRLKASRRGGYEGAIDTFNDDKLRIRLFGSLSKLPDIKSRAMFKLATYN